MKLILILPAVFMLAACKPKMAKNETDIYEFVNQLFIQTAPFEFAKIRCIAARDIHPIGFTEEDSIELLKMDTIFNLQDISVMREQATSQSDFKFKQEYINGKTVISLDSLRSHRQMTESFWSQLKDRYGVDDFLTISKPIFSKDKSKVIVTINHYGKRGGSGGTFVYRKENGTWKNLKMLTFWDN